MSLMNGELGLPERGDRYPQIPALEGPGIEGGIEKKPELPPSDKELEPYLWLRRLAEFIVEANTKTWAADAGEVLPEQVERKGHKEHEYVRGDWRLRDSYTGYFRAPGMTTVYYKEVPVWIMAYGGHGQTEEYYDQAKATFGFLREALKRVSPDMPFRGPKEYVEGNKRYVFILLEGDITDCTWEEKVFEDGGVTFTQTGFAGLVLHRGEDKKVRYPWEL